MAVNEYYDSTSIPPTRSPVASAPIRAEYNLIEEAFNKLPVMAGNGGKVVIVHPSGTSLTTLDIGAVAGGIFAPINDPVFTGVVSAPDLVVDNQIVGQFIHASGTLDASGPGSGSLSTDGGLWVAKSAEINLSLIVYGPVDTNGSIQVHGAAPGGNMLVKVENVSNTADSGALFHAKVGSAATTGDPGLLLEVDGTAFWKAGLDRTDLKFKISNSNALGTTDALIIDPTTLRTTLSGSLNFTGASRRIQADFSTSPINLRTMFQSSVVNGATHVETIPNGASVTSSFITNNNSDPLLGSRFLHSITATAASLNSTRQGAAPFLPISLLTSDIERLNIGVAGETTLFGNFIINGTSRRIQADFSTATIAQRCCLQTTLLNGTTSIHAIPNGTGTTGQFIAHSSSDPDNGSEIRLAVLGTTAQINATARGSGTAPSLAFQTSNVERIGITAAGAITIATTASLFVNSATNFANVVNQSYSAPGADVSLTINNADNTNGASNARLIVSTAGASSGDPYAVFYNPNSQPFSLGLRRSTNLFKICAGVGIAAGDCITINSSGTVTIPNTLVVNGTLSAGTFNPASISTTTITTSGNITTNALFPANGIYFPAAQSAQGQPNALDDFEKGTWTPSVGGTATYFSQVGTYTKIGDLVTLEGFLNIQFIGTGSTNAISGIPFARAATGFHASGVVSQWSQIVGGVVFMSVQIASGGSTINVGSAATATLSTAVANAVLANSAALRFTITYKAAN